MHEASLVRVLLRQVEELVTRHAARRATVVKVRIGEFAGVEPDLLASAFEQLATSPAVCGSKLELTRVPLTLRCRSCGASSTVARFDFRCSSCGGVEVDLASGEEMLLESVTMEAEP